MAALCISVYHLRHCNPETRGTSDENERHVSQSKVQLCFYYVNLRLVLSCFYSSLVSDSLYYALLLILDFIVGKYILYVLSHDYEHRIASERVPPEPHYCGISMLKDVWSTCGDKKLIVFQLNKVIPSWPRLLATVCGCDHDLLLWTTCIVDDFSWEWKHPYQLDMANINAVRRLYNRHHETGVFMQAAFVVMVLS